jgi:hypothetical protein
VPIHPNTWAPISGVSQQVVEAACEFNLPLVGSDAKLGALNLNGAIRYAEYDNDSSDSLVASHTFDATTWKVGITRDVTDQLTFR